MVLNQNNLKTLFKFYKDYKNTQVLSPVEYVKGRKEKTRLNDQEIDLFLKLTKHEQLLEALANYILKKNALNRVNKASAELILFLIVFLVDDDNLEAILEFCYQIKCFYLCHLITTIVDANEHLIICQLACKYFDNLYVMDNIIDPFLNKIPIIVNLGRDYLKLFEIKPIPNVKPHTFNFVKQLYKKIPYPPANTPAIRRRFKAVPIPPSTWKPDKSGERRLLQVKEQNKKRAKELLLQASQVPERLMQGRSISPGHELSLSGEAFKSKPIPHFKSVQVKGNITTTLREASRITKIQEEDVKKIDDIMKGGYSKETIEKIEEELKNQNEARELEIIERNHLKGLLSYEESILAKRKLLETNKQKMEKFREDRVELLQNLQHWREEEEQKIRSLVEKSQQIKQNMKNNEKKLLEKKQEDVRIQQYETKQMLEQVMVEKANELARKVELIQEIKAIHQVRCNIKEFDPTETPNLGLLCEMSITELQERLAITKAQMKQELEEKRQTILKRKEDHQKMIENMKKLISENRSRRTKPMTNISTTTKVVPENPELLDLRKRLEEKRQLRNNLQ